SGQRAPQGPQLPPRAPHDPRRHGAADRPARRRDRLRGDLLRRRARARRAPARRRGRGLEGRHGDRRLRARPHAAQPGALPENRPGAGRALPRARGRGRRRPARGGRALLDGRRGLRARDLPHRLAPARRRPHRLRGQPQQDLLVGARPAHARDRPAPARPPRRPAARGAGGPRRRSLARRLAVRALRPDLRRHQRDPAQRDRRAHPRPAPELLMRFATGEQALLLQQTLREFLRKECPPETVRALWAREDGHDPALWGRLAALGVPGALVPEADGGLGLDERDLVLLLEEIGRAALPVPVVATAAVAAPLLRDLAAAGAPGAARARAWLPRIADGSLRVAVGHPANPFVTDAEAAGLLLLPDDDALHAVPREEARLTRQPANDPGR